MVDSGLVLDGGNIVLLGQTAIITMKVYEENPNIGDVIKGRWLSKNTPMESFPSMGVLFKLEKLNQAFVFFGGKTYGTKMPGVGIGYLPFSSGRVGGCASKA